MKKMGDRMPEIKRWVVPIIISCFSVVFVVNCEKDRVVNDEPKACEASHREDFIAKWSTPVFDGGLMSCVDTLCIEFDLELFPDSTYLLSYVLFNSNQSPMPVYSLADTGIYRFDCMETGTFRTRFTYEYVKGTLELHSETEPLRILNIYWDAFWGLDIDPEELGLNFSARLLLQREE
jgi:hypothetical protein